MSTVNKAWKSLIDSEKFYFIRQIIKFKTKYKSFFKAHVEWNGILGDFDSKQKLSDLKNMSRFLHEFFKMKNPEKYDPFEWIVSRNEINWVKFLLRFVKDLNQTSEVGSETNFKETTYNTESHEPAFFTACFEGYTEIVELLMNVSKDDKIIDYNWQDLGGRTPFQIACERGETKIVKLFLKHAEELKIDLNSRSNVLNRNAVCSAILEKNDEVVDLLLQDPRFDVHSQDQEVNSLNQAIFHIFL